MKKYISYLKEKGLRSFIKLSFIHFVTTIVSFPIAVVCVVFSPWRRLRLIRLFSYRIGHYALNTELLLCAQDNKLFYDTKKYHTFYFTFPGEPICNIQLHRMWKRTITIFPCSYLWSQVDKFLKIIYGKEYKNDPWKNEFEPSDGARDRWFYLENNLPHLSFTKDEVKNAKVLLSQLGIKENTPFVCLLGRDSGYLKSYLPNTDWSYHDYRDVKIDSYYQAVEYLANKGYTVLRMGKYSSDELKLNHSNVIDYAHHPLRSDFLDIYLSANCAFFISVRSGIDAIAQIFRRPLILVNFPLCDYRALYYLNLFIPKKVIDLKSRNLISFKEMCWSVHRPSIKKMLDEKKWGFIDNTPDEIMDALKEMLGRLEKTWNEAENSAVLQEKFWQCVPELGAHDTHNMRIGDIFLRDHQILLNETPKDSNSYV